MVDRVAVAEIPVEEDEVAAECERRRDDPQARTPAFAAASTAGV